MAKAKVNPKVKWFNGLKEYVDKNGMVPSALSPICQKCTLDTKGCQNPYLDYMGTTTPKVTILMESVSRKDDVNGRMGNEEGWTAYVLDHFQKISEKYADLKDFKMEDIRVLSMVRCAPPAGTTLKTKAQWCRSYVVDDLIKHPPKLIVPVGTMPLGMLSHKSNAMDWAGKILTYRGWPDDWLVNPMFDESHPIFGPRPGPEKYIPILPILAPRLMVATQNRIVKAEWMGHIRDAMRLAKKGTPALSHTRKWYRLTTDVELIKRELTWLAKNPGTLLSFDTETTGLKPFGENQRIVMMMFRWDRDGKPVSLAFPWDYETSALLPFIPELTPFVLRALYASRLQGHNLAFDILFTFATLADARQADARLHKLTSAMYADSMHLLYTLTQKTGSMGLELLAYDRVPALAGYEEEMTFLIDRHENMNPKFGGHYANCPPSLWKKALEPYVLGDVEVCHLGSDVMREELAETEPWKIPLAHPTIRGRFKFFRTPSRNDVSERVMRPANRLLTRMMGRGMRIDLQELDNQENRMPKQIIDARAAIKKSDERIMLWAEFNEAATPGWEFDLEVKDQLKQVLFKVLGLKIQRLTKTGRKEFGENEDEWRKRTPEEIYKYAAVDKFTLNSLAATHPEVRPLQEYRKLYKQYTGFIRPLRNHFAEGVDKKPRTKPQHLMPDGRIHGILGLTNTRSGRLGSREPNLQNMPKEGAFKRVIVSRFEDRGCLYESDLSQIELRVTACACGDASMVEAYEKGLDLHSLTHSKIYKRSYDDCTKKGMERLSKKDPSLGKKLELERRVAKIVNFLTSYGGGALGLQSILAAQSEPVYLTEDQCKEIIAKFFESYPSLRDLISAYKQFISDNGCAVSILGRVRWFDEVYSADRQQSSKALRAGVNHLIQSTASDMMLLSLCYIEEQMRKEKLKSILISTVHDSLLIDAKINELDAVHRIVTGALNDIPRVLKHYFGADYQTRWMLTKFGCDSSCGFNYGDLVKVPDGAVDWRALLEQSRH